MDRKSLYIVFPFLLFGLSACIERYYPDESKLKTGTLVINAHLTNQQGMQEIEISRSAPLIYPKLPPVQGSFAELIREDGETREFSENRPGFYGCDLDEEFLQTGLSYSVHIILPDGNEYESEYDKLRPVPEIDSIYYLVEKNSYATESDSIGGVRFYIDFTYDKEEYDYIRWDLTETYEFHNPDIEAFILDVDHVMKVLPDSSNWKICYITNELHTIHSMSMGYLDFGIYIKKPFSFVPNIQLEQKLHHKYSLLVRQHSIGKEAFYYWNELKKNTQEQGWLFDKQPAMLRSNFCNVNNEEERILGFFSMSSVVEKRAFAEHVEGLDTRPYRWYCYPQDKAPGGLMSPEDLPMYFARAWIEGEPVFSDVNKHCVDCRAYKHSTHIKPDFW